MSYKLILIIKKYYESRMLGTEEKLKSAAKKPNLGWTAELVN